MHPVKVNRKNVRGIVAKNGGIAKLSDETGR
nr:hypothetical protein HUO10_004404 [Paraburkholderia busanensis]